MTRTRWAIAAAFTALGGCALVPGTSCNLMFAPSNLHIVFDGEMSAEAEWSVELELQDRTVRCVAVDPGLSTPCDDNGATSMTLSNAGVPNVIDTQHTEDQVVVRILREDEVEHTATLEPDYEVDEPNGKGCGERRVAIELVAW